MRPLIMQVVRFLLDKQDLLVNSYNRVFQMEISLNTFKVQEQAEVAMKSLIDVMDTWLAKCKSAKVEDPGFKSSLVKARHI